MQRTVIRKDAGDLYVYEFKHGTQPNKKIWVAWHPTGPAPGVKPTGKKKSITLTSLPSLPTKVSEMAIADGPAKAAKWKKAGANKISLKIGESPVYIKFSR